MVVYFYPKDNTPGCTREAISFTESLRWFTGRDVEVIGVSPDGQESHCRFTEKHKLQITLLADVEHKMSEAFGVWQLKKNYGKEYMGIVRSTFIIDPQGRVAYRWKSVKVDGHIDAVKGKLKTLLKEA